MPLMKSCSLSCLSHGHLTLGYGMVVTSNPKSAPNSIRIDIISALKSKEVLMKF